MKSGCKILSIFLALLMILSMTVGCNPSTDTDEATGNISDTVAESTASEETESQEPTDTSADTSEDTETDTEAETEAERVGSVSILNGTEITLEVGATVRLTTYKSSFIQESVVWTADRDIVDVTENGLVTALEVGVVTVTATAGQATDSIRINVVEKTEETTEAPETTAPTYPGEVETGERNLETLAPDEIHEAVGSPSGYRPAGSYEEALERTENKQLSGYDFVPDQAPILSEYRPMQDGMYVKNTDSYYVDYNTYVVVDVYGREVFRVYRGGAYITLEEIAAYVYAFGTFPANHSAKKTTTVSGNAWGIYLRSNHTKFSGDTSRYPYEPELPRISGCGGDLQYWEMDIGTTGTDCDPAYPPRVYNNGTKIDRGAARIVYTWNDLNDNGLADATDAIFIFYTYNHYNDFQEYLNYYGGWGEMFGNITGGGKISSKTDYNPTPYVPVVAASLASVAVEAHIDECVILYAWIDPRAFHVAYAA